MPVRMLALCGASALSAQDRVSSGRFEMPAAAIDFAKAEIVMTPERIAVVPNIIAESWQGVKPNCFLMPVSLESVELGNDAPDGAPPSWSMAAGKSKWAAAR